MDVEELRGLPPLDGISEAGLERVAACAAEISREAGQVLALPDDPGSGMYVIREGTVAVELRTGTLELGPGDFFGELGALDWGAGFSYPRLATVVAKQPLSLLVFPDGSLNQLIRDFPVLGDEITARAHERAQHH